MEKNKKIPLNIKRIPIKICSQIESSFLGPNNKSNQKHNKQNNYRYSKALKNSFYSYPIAIFKKPNDYEDYKERLLLSEKQKKKKPLLNKNYHHISFKSHSNSMFFNRNDKNNNNISNLSDLFKTQTPHSNKTRNRNNNNQEINSFYKTFYNRENKVQNNSNIFQQNYLSEVEKRGFNYNKVIQLTSLQRSIMNNFIKNDNSDNYIYVNNELIKYNPNNYVLEVKTRKYFPPMKEFLVNKYRNIKQSKMKLRDKKYINDDRAKSVINIKNNPKFKFHVFHDRKGKVKELDKPCKRNLKMTRAKVRDLKIMQKINKINDPEIINMYKSLL